MRGTGAKDIAVYGGEIEQLVESGPLTIGAALAASSWRIWCRALASNDREASLKEPSDVARIPNRR